MSTPDPFDRDRALVREVVAVVLTLAGLVASIAVAGHYGGPWAVLGVVAVVLLATGLTLGFT